jgi:hypothetical protein
MKRFAIVIIGLVLCACTDETGATKALKDAGLTPVKVGGYAWLSCGSKDDVYATKFTAKNIKGETVTGAVCSGVFKGKTVRFD